MNDEHTALYLARNCAHIVGVLLLLLIVVVAYCCYQFAYSSSRTRLVRAWTVCFWFRIPKQTNTCAVRYVNISPCALEKWGTLSEWLWIECVCVCVLCAVQCSVCVLLHIIFGLCLYAPAAAAACCCCCIGGIRRSNTRPCVWTRAHFCLGMCMRPQMDGWMDGWHKTVIRRTIVSYIML